MSSNHPEDRQQSPEDPTEQQQSPYFESVSEFGNEQESDHNQDASAIASSPAIVSLASTYRRRPSRSLFFHSSNLQARLFSPEPDAQPSSSSTQNHSDASPSSWASITSIKRLLRGAHGDAQSSRLNIERGENPIPGDDDNQSTGTDYQSVDGESVTKGDTKEFYTDDEPEMEEYICPICQDLLSEVSVTECGHTYCYTCISQHLNQSQSCPVCRTRLSLKRIFPNFQFNKVVSQYRERKERMREEESLGRMPVRTRKFGRPYYATAVANVTKNLSCEDSARIFLSILRKKQQEKLNEQNLKTELLEIFLERLRAKSQQDIDKLKSQISVIDKDLERIRSSHEHDDSDKDERQEEEPSAGNSRLTKRKFLETLESQDVVASSGRKLKQQRMMERFHDLEEQYFQQIQSDKLSLDSFSSMLYETTRYSKFRVLDTMFYTNMSASSSIVSSIEFDRDDEYFAVGGVTRDIKIYEFNMVNSGDDDMGDRENLSIPGTNRSDSNYIGSSFKTLAAHCPVKVLDVGHKVSCLSWNQYIKGQLASSDYDGNIKVWDVKASQCVFQFAEHAKRAWSVDFCTANPSYLASGSDDSTVKLWTTTSHRSVTTLSLKGNVCCVKFAPNNANYLAVGTADHQVSCYDLRYPTSEYLTFAGHAKAVSYVRWLSDYQILSASTDSSLKRWHINTSECEMTYRGHLNEKNFVGLSVHKDWISCGSEDNSVFAYHKETQSPVARYKFPTMSDLMRGDMASDENQSLFVSSTCWKRDTNKIIAANSRGMIKVLAME